MFQIWSTGSIRRELLLSYSNLLSRGKKASATVKKFRVRRSLKTMAVDALEARKVKKLYYGMVIPKPKLIHWIEERETVTIGAVLNFITTRGEVRSFPAVRERLEDDVKIERISSDLGKAVSFSRESLPPAGAETEAYLADMMKRVDARRAQSGSAGLLNPKDHIVNGKVVVRSNRGKTVRITGQRGAMLAVKSF
jgi:hypothetical protein